MISPEARQSLNAYEKKRRIARGERFLARLGTGGIFIFAMAAIYLFPALERDHVVTQIQSVDRECSTTHTNDPDLRRVCDKAAEAAASAPAAPVLLPGSTRTEVVQAPPLTQTVVPPAVTVTQSIPFPLPTVSVVQLPGSTDTSLIPIPGPTKTETETQTVTAPPQTVTVTQDAPPPETSTSTTTSTSTVTCTQGVLSSDC